jgi:hypothetical protein
VTTEEKHDDDRYDVERLLGRGAGPDEEGGNCWI